MAVFGHIIEKRTAGRLRRWLSARFVGEGMAAVNSPGANATITCRYGELSLIRCRPLKFNLDNYNNYAKCFGFREQSSKIE